jgi:hypothetical protein
MRGSRPRSRRLPREGSYSFWVFPCCSIRRRILTMSVDWAAVGTVSGLLVGVGGLVWKIRSDRRAEERESRARRPDVKVLIESRMNWGSREDRAVRVRVVNDGDIQVKVIKVSFREGSPSRQLALSPWERSRIANAKMWSLEEGEAELPKEIPARDGHPFTLPVPFKDPPFDPSRRVVVRPRPRDSRLSAEKRIQAWVKISTGELFRSPVYSSKVPPLPLVVIWDPSEGRGR